MTQQKQQQQQQQQQMKKKLTIPPLLSVNPVRVWRKSKICSNPVLHLVGHSRSADSTFFHIPELKFGLDAGEARGRQPDFIFLTHGHSDHAKGIAYLMKNLKTKMYSPRPCVNFLRAVSVAQMELDDCQNLSTSSPSSSSSSSSSSSALIPSRFDSSFDLNLNFIGVENGEVFEVGKKNQMVVEVFECVHSVPCVGFGFSQKRNKLKDEYKGLTPKEFGNLKKQGIEIAESCLFHLFVYMGDTHVSVFDKHPSLFKYQTIIVECTFLEMDKELEKRCQESGHIAWPQLEPYVLSHPTTTFVLIHFSCRYKEHEIFKYFEQLETREVNPLNLSNVILHVNHESEGKF